MLLATSVPVRADEAKIGIIDSQRIFAEYQGLGGRGSQVDSNGVSHAAPPLEAGFSTASIFAAARSTARLMRP